MKKYYSLALMASLAFAANAAQLSPQEALGRLESSRSRVPAKVKITDAATPLMKVNAPNNPRFTSLYVFEGNSGGYMIVSADDCAAPLLGYSDSERFDAANIPPQLKYWLDFYAAEIEYAAAHNAPVATAAAASDSRAEIAPMLTTQWNQSAPYNDECPMDQGQRSVTGCVATAMAQALNYHKWPTTGTGSNSYSWNGTTLSFNFGSTTFDWNNMADTYDSSSTAAQKKAVSTLMYACGVSVDMDYSSSESGASSLAIAPALYKYFGYSAAMTMPERAFYTTSDWENMVYSQLQQGIPVLYGGVSSQGGHQFVCDGYSTGGYFHFNWGWAGMSDGYYLLSALDPTSQGIGGSTTGFNYDQSIVMNMKPATTPVQVTPLVYCYGEFEASSTTTQLGAEASFTAGNDTGFYNFGCSTIKGGMGIKIVSASGQTTYVMETRDYSIESQSGFGSISVTLPRSLANGTYTVTPVFKSSDSSEYVDILSPLSGVQALSMDVQSGQVSFTPITTNTIQISNFNINSTVYLNTNFKATFNVANTGTTEYYGQLMFGLVDSQGDEAGISSSALAVDVMPGDNSDQTYIAYFPSQLSSGNQTVTVSPGQYYIVVYDYLTQKVVYTYQQPVTVQSAPGAASLTVTNFAIQGGNQVVDPSAVKFTGSVECTSGYYADQLTIAVFAEGAESTDITGATDYLFLSAGDQSNFSATVDITGAQAGATYYAAVYALKNGQNQQISNAISFTVKTDGSIEITPAQDSSEDAIYNLQGIRVDPRNLTPGLYIIGGQKVLINE